MRDGFIVAVFVLVFFACCGIVIDKLENIRVEITSLEVELNEVINSREMSDNSLGDN